MKVNRMKKERKKILWTMRRNRWQVKFPISVNIRVSERALKRCHHQWRKEMDEIAKESVKTSISGDWMIFRLSLYVIRCLRTTVVAFHSLGDIIVYSLSFKCDRKHFNIVSFTSDSLTHHYWMAAVKCKLWKNVSWTMKREKILDLWYHSSCSWSS